MSEHKDLSCAALLKSDKFLSEHTDKFTKLGAEFNSAASQDTVNATVKSLEKKGFLVKLAKDRADALSYITALPKDGQTISSGASTTLDEIGYTTWAKGQTKNKDWKAIAIEKQNAGDWGGAGAARKQGAIADWYYAGCTAVTEDGEILWASASGTRVSVWAHNLVFVVGSNKITKNWAKAMERLFEWQFHIESARARVVYKNDGSTITEIGALKQCNPFAPKSVQVVIVPESLGF